MNYFRKLTITIALLLCSTSTSNAIDFIDLETEVSFGNQQIAGTFQYNGDKIDVSDSLGMDKGSQVAFRMKFKHSLPVFPDFYFHYTPSRFVGEKVLSTTLDYGGTTYSADVKTTSILEIGRSDLGFFYNVPFINALSLGASNLEYGLNLRLLNVASELSGDVSGVSQTTSSTESVVIPMLYSAFSYRIIRPLSISAEIKYIGLGDDSIMDMNFEFKVNVKKYLFFSLGYFKEDIDISAGDTKANITISYPYASIGANF